MHAGFSLRSLAFDYVQWITLTFGDLDAYQAWLIPLLLAAAVALAFAARPRTLPAGLPGRWAASPPVYCAYLLASALLARMPFLMISVMPNPDEGNMMAGAHKLAYDPVFWRSVDGITAGPLDYYFPLLFRIFGLPLDYATARLANLVCFAGAAIFLYLAARFIMPEWAARLGALPLLAAVMCARFPEFVQYSTECVPILLIAASVYGIARCCRKPPVPARELLLASLPISLLPFGKLQAIPMAAVLAAAGLAAILLSGDARRRRAVLWFAAGPAAVAAVALTLLAYEGVLHDFYRSYLSNNFTYANASELQWTPGQFARFAFSTGEMTAFLPWVALFIGGAMAWQAGKGRRRLLAAAGLALALFAASAYAAYRPGRPYFHYLLFLWFPLALGAAASLAALLPESGAAPAARSNLVPAVVFLALTVAAPVAFRIAGGTRPLDSLAEFPEMDSPLAAAALARLAAPGELVGMWGWAPELYVLTGTLPATRDLDTASQSRDGPQRVYYLRRYIDDLGRQAPKVFVDAVGPQRFHFHDRQAEGHEAWPELRRYIEAHYDLVCDVEGARMYRRR